MNDAAVNALWKRVNELAMAITRLEDQVLTLEARSRARLKEEAEAREKWKGLGGGYHGTGRV